MIAKELQKLIPAAVGVVDLEDASIGELEARHAVGLGAATVKGMKVTLGQRLSGWVAANRRTILNSDAALDLGDFDLGKALKSCISTVLVAQESLVGVLTLYSTEVNGFDEDHRRIIEGTSRQIANAFRNGASSDQTLNRTDSLGTLPYLSQLQQFVDVTGSNHLDQKSSLSLLLIEIIGLERINLVDGRGAKEAALKHVLCHSSTCLRSADILFRHGSDEFVVLLNDTTQDAAAIVSQRIRESIRQNPLRLRDDMSVDVEVSMANVNPADDSRSLARLVDEARGRNRQVSHRREKTRV